MLKISVLLLAGVSALAAPPPQKFSTYTEKVTAGVKFTPQYLQFKEKQKNNFKISGSLVGLFDQAARRIEVPGMLSAQELPALGRIVGPSTEKPNFTNNEVIYVRWHNDAVPKAGDVFSIYTPTYVFQNEEDLTDFRFHVRTGPGQKPPSGYRIAGFLYESNGEMQVQQSKDGIVTARLLRILQPIAVNDEIMQELPVYTNITPVRTPEALGAVIVAGSPVERISSSMQSFLYINRGVRDGVKLGSMFSAVESLRVDDPAMPWTEKNLGEVMVVHVNDTYSTAIVTSQLDVVRIGGLLKGKSNITNEKESFALRSKNGEEPEAAPAGEDLPPEAKELRSDILGLSSQERQRLMRLDAEANLPAEADPSAAPADSGALENQAMENGKAANAAPNLPPPPSVFKKNEKKVAKKDEKKPGKGKKSGPSDEQHLNQLMQQ